MRRTTRRTTQQSTPKRRGFTRVEIVAVGAVAMVLATTLLPLLPSFAHDGDVAMEDRENVRRAWCQAHLKQIALAIREYTQDWDEAFPIIAGGPGENESGWAASVQPYLQDVQLLQCPSDKMAILRVSNTAKSE